jgi:hypothetical protein
MDMNEKINRLIPELKLPEILKLIKTNPSVSSLSFEWQRMIASTVIKKLSSFYNFSFWDRSNREEENLNLYVWEGGISDLNVKSVFAGLIGCILGKTQYIDKPPSNVVAFHRVCKDSSFPASYRLEPLGQSYVTIDGLRPPDKPELGEGYQNFKKQFSVILEKSKPGYLKNHELLR